MAPGKAFAKGATKKACGSVVEITKQLDELQAKMGEVDSYLSVDIDEKAIARIYKQIKRLEQTEIGLKVQLESIAGFKIADKGAPFAAGWRAKAVPPYICQQF